MRVVSPVVLSGPLKTGGGVTVPATEDTGIINTDIPAADAVAELPLPRIFSRRDRKPEDILDKFIIDTFPGFDPIRR